MKALLTLSFPAPPSASSTPRSTDQGFPVYPAFSEKRFCLHHERSDGGSKRSQPSQGDEMRHPDPQFHAPGNALALYLEALYSLTPSPLLRPSFFLPLMYSSTRSERLSEQTSHSLAVQSSKFSVPAAGRRMVQPFWRRR